MHRISTALLALALAVAGGAAQAITYTGAGSAWSQYSNHDGVWPPGVTYCSGQQCLADNDKWGSTAHLAAMMSPGLISVEMQATGWGDGYSTVGYRGYFGDSFTVLSNTLAAGSLVTVRYAVRFDITSSGTSGYNPGFTVSLGPYPDCCHAIFNQWNNAGGSVIPAGGVVMAYAQVAVGSVHDLTGQLVAGTGREHRDPGVSSVQGSVHFYVDVMDAAATIQAASGHDYGMSAAVPEPQAWLMLSAGVALLALRRRASHPEARPPGGSGPDR